MRKPYFPTAAGAPAPLVQTTERTVRFEEVDAMGIVWHGRYPSYFEDGRVALGARYGIGYADFIRERVPVPIRHLQVDYVRPLRFEDRVRIETTLHWSEAARINVSYVLRDDQGRVACTGCTVQMMLDANLEVLLAPPPFFANFLARWQGGALA